jgi:hypothetical protein
MFTKFKGSVLFRDLPPDNGNKRFSSISTVVVDNFVEKAPRLALTYSQVKASSILHTDCAFVIDGKNALL